MTMRLPKDLRFVFRDDNVKWVSDLIDDNGRVWNKALIHNIFSVKEAEEILQLPIIGELGRKDKLVWSFNKDGKFSVKTCYKAIMDQKELTKCQPESSRGAVALKKIWNSIWKIKIKPKLRIFLWRAKDNFCQCMCPPYVGSGFGGIVVEESGVLCRGWEVFIDQSHDHAEALLLGIKHALWKAFLLSWKSIAVSIDDEDMAQALQAGNVFQGSSPVQTTSVLERSSAEGCDLFVRCPARVGASRYLQIDAGGFLSSNPLKLKLVLGD
ncbi:Ribonuclease H-like superfamily protein [Striga hermonthica]|uniref:Ribonuclease H-like superfamily protein n=1 Tax=Striga hermonthica TaxID=68872 RepID=A0A9N7RIF5_STRHE|nr:Ribonuclease H-like superfamily protein [Striga hermonthica]